MPDSEPPPEWSWRVLLYWSDERKRWSEYLDRRLGGGPPTKEEEARRGLRLILLLRIVNTLILGSIALGLCFGYPLHWQFQAALVVVYLLWFPWRAIRALAAFALAPALFLAAWMALIILAGPHGTGPMHLGLPLLVASAALLLSLAGLGVLELRSPEGTEFPGAGGLVLHAAALLLIGWIFLRAGEERAAVAAVEEQRSSQAASVEDARTADPEDQFQLNNFASQKHVRLMTPKQWKAQEFDTRTWVRTMGDRLPPEKRPAYEREWEAIFRQKELEASPWRRLFGKKPGT